MAGTLIGFIDVPAGNMLALLQGMPLQLGSRHLFQLLFACLLFLCDHHVVACGCYRTSGSTGYSAWLMFRAKTVDRLF
jgi:hypothetical protein